MAATPSPAPRQSTPTRPDRLVHDAAGSGAFVTLARGRETNVEIGAAVPKILSRGLLPLVQAVDVVPIVNMSFNAARMAKSFDVAALDGDPSAKYRKLFGADAGSGLAIPPGTAAVVPELIARDVHILSTDPGATRMKRAAEVFFKPSEVAAACVMDLIEDGGRFDAGSHVEKAKTRPLLLWEDADTAIAYVERIRSTGFAASWRRGPTWTQSSQASRPGDARARHSDDDDR